MAKNRLPFLGNESTIYNNRRYTSQCDGSNEETFEQQSTMHFFLLRVRALGMYSRVNMRITLEHAF